MATLVKGTVKLPAGKVIKTQYGDRINVVVELPTKEQIKLWGKPGDILASYTKGDEIVLLAEGGKYKPLAIPPEDEKDGNKKLPSTEQTPSPETIAHFCHLLATCYQEMSRQMEGLPQELIKDMAITVFISLSRKM